MPDQAFDHSDTDQDYRPVITRTPLLNEGSVEAKRQEILDYFHATFSLYESLFECLDGDDAFLTRANPLRHPLIFYYGHTAVFFINKLNVAGLITARVDTKIESMLAIGVDEMSWDDLNEDHYDWPGPAEVKAYRDRTREIVDHFIRNCELTLPIDWHDPMWIIMMGIEHERIHLETTAVLLRELPLDRLKPHPVWSHICRETGEVPVNELLPVEGGEVILGKARDNPLYGWDNEYGHQTMDVASFNASKYLVSNQEFLTFVDDGGYQTQSYWTSEGWDWVRFRQATHPAYWVKDGDTFRYRSMLSLIDMPWNWPVDINFLEATAFCNWKSEKTGKHIRMPTEAEWHKLRQLVDTDQPYWDEAPGNINLEGEMSACPVDRHEFANGFFDIIGNVWQWTETPIDGFAGFETHPVYDDFSCPTYDGKHNLFKGGCWISTGNYAIRDARYAFRRHFFQYSGLRYVEGAALLETKVSHCETDEMICRDIEFNYGAPQDGQRNFHTAGVEAALAHMGDLNRDRALDIGCATGRASFELAKHFDHVDAIDFSARLIQVPANLQSTGAQRYIVQDEGELVLYRSIRLSEFGAGADIQNKVSFTQGDACNLADKYARYDLVLALDLIEHLYDPASFLEAIKTRINTGGFLALSSTYDWQADVTPRGKWLGGFKADTGETYTGLDGIAGRLEPEFERVGDLIDLPFVLRLTSRTSRAGVSQMSVWKKL